MKAAPQEQWRLLDVAETDRLLAQTAHRRKTLPELAELSQLAVQRRDLAEEVVRLATEVSDAQEEEAQVEHDLQPARARLERNQKTVDDGLLSDHKALVGLTDEIEHLKRRISDLEDTELEAMQRLEDAQKVHEEADRRRLTLDDHIRGVLKSRDDHFAEIDRQLKQLTEQRRAQAAGIPADLLKLYETLRTRTGQGAGRLHRGVCESCGITINAADLRRFASAGEDEVLRCEECDRILVRTADSGL
ncbi:nucleic acid-binding protein [Acidipropionibacterium jensenii]|uniref:zinc ribbon domain-containing protein n=1 Tax=Acidipropionibacterium jensenii TaxID=1749 RepID=UPI00110ACE1F|nr:C4-type zinc ribbon domain-containing protein [Acidipropionibacterium jensenii]QCV87081.1 nucleic acid-binding protein [Acidipropionibacterium jensenii]